MSDCAARWVVARPAVRKSSVLRLQPLMCSSMAQYVCVVLCVVVWPAVREALLARFRCMSTYLAVTNIPGGFETSKGSCRLSTASGVETL